MGLLETVYVFEDGLLVEEGIASNSKCVLFLFSPFLCGGDGECHLDDALRILDAGTGATPAEREVLGAFRRGSCSCLIGLPWRAKEQAQANHGHHAVRLSTVDS